jgi:hypothetical protein
LLDDVLLSAPMAGSVALWGFWPAWIGWLAVFVIGGALLSELVIRAVAGRPISGRVGRRLAGAFARSAANDPVARWYRRLGGRLALVATTIVLGPPVASGVLTLARSQRPSRREIGWLCALYALVWVTVYTGGTALILR